MSLFALLGLPIYAILAYYVLYKYVVPREGCRKYFILCLIVSASLQVLIRFCLLTDIPWIVEYNVGKLLTIFMVILLVFWGGSLVHGGWVRIGIYLIVTEIVFSISSRAYWLIWGFVTHASQEDILIHARVLSFDRATGFQFLVDSVICILLLIPASKLRKIPIRPLRPAQIIVIAYLAYGCMPFTNRVGFDDGSIMPMFFCGLAFTIFIFLLWIAIMKTAERDEQHMLELKQRALSEQAQAIYLQKNRVRKFRHDIRKHLDALGYLLKESPDLQKDPSFIQYQHEMEAYEKAFRRLYYCDSEELNISLAQIDQYCLDHNIPVKIYLKRLRFPGWKRDDQLVFGMLLYQFFLAGTDYPVSGVQIRGDCLQGQNILRMEINYACDRGHQKDAEEVGSDHDIACKVALEDISGVLHQYAGSCMTEQSESRIVYLLHWNDGEEICLSGQYC